MTPEEFQRIKEAEKEHLRALKKLKEAVHLLKRRNAVNQALGNMAGAHNTLDDQDEMIDQLARETALNEARLEIALESSTAREALAADAAEADAPTRSAEAFEAELLEARAKALLRQIKLQMGAPDEDARSEPPARAAASGAEAERAAPPPPPAGLPDKTIGRIKKT